MAGKTEQRKENDPALWRRHQRIFRVLVFVLRGWLRRKFNFSYEDAGLRGIEGPVIIVPNHVCAWDPLLIGIAFGGRQIYYVASEHVLRLRFFGPILNRLVAPVPRRKASSGTSTVMACLRHLKAGHTICLFAEGEQTWDGITHPTFAGTGKLVRQSGATLVTYRIEGAYLSLPRWARGVRRGRVYGHPAGIYPPEVLKGMTPAEINKTIARDLAFDVWKWQDEQPDGPVRFVLKSGRFGLAQGMEKQLFVCPKCRAVGTLASSGDEVRCSCGFRVRYQETGFFEPAEPFRTNAEWDAFDRSFLNGWIDRMLAEKEDQVLFRDGPAELSLVEDGHRDIPVATGTLSLSHEKGRILLAVGDRRFDLTEIPMMAPVLSDRLMFTAGGTYYQLWSVNKDINLRKYNMAWEHMTQQVPQAPDDSKSE